MGPHRMHALLGDHGAVLTLGISYVRTSLVSLGSAIPPSKGYRLFDSVKSHRSRGGKRSRPALNLSTASAVKTASGPFGSCSAPRFELQLARSIWKALGPQPHPPSADRGLCPAKVPPSPSGHGSREVLPPDRCRELSAAGLACAATVCSLRRRSSMQTGGVATLHAEQRPSRLHDPPPPACNPPWPACDHGPAADNAGGQLAAAEPDCHLSAARRPCAGSHACQSQGVSPSKTALRCF